MAHEASFMSLELTLGIITISVSKLQADSSMALTNRSQASERGRCKCCTTSLRRKRCGGPRDGLMRSPSLTSFCFLDGCLSRSKSSNHERREGFVTGKSTLWAHKTPAGRGGYGFGCRWQRGLVFAKIFNPLIQQLNHSRFKGKKISEGFFLVLYS